MRSEAGERRRAGRFSIEEERLLGRAMDAGFEPAEVYFVSEWLGEEAGGLVERAAAAGAALFEVSEPVLRKAAYRRNPRGFIAVMKAPVRRLVDLPAGGPGPLIVCNALEKPGNLGAILRSADAAGAAAVLPDRPHPDVFNPNCLRASAGAAFSVPIVGAEPGELIDWLRGHRTPIIAVTPDAPRTCFEADLSGRCAIVLGAEAEGLGDTWREAADAAVSIPMRGTVDSLNVSVAAAIILYEAARQRV